MRTLIETYGYIIISIITGMAIITIAGTQISDIQDMKQKNEEQVLSVMYSSANNHKAPVFISIPEEEPLLQADASIKYDWNYFINGVEVRDNDGQDITDNVEIHVYKVFSKDTVERLSLSSDLFYVGALTKDNASELYTLDNCDLDVDGDIYLGTDFEKVGHLSYKSFLDNDYKTNFSCKYKLLYQVVDNDGYKAEYSTVCVIESEEMINNLSLNIITPEIKNEYDDLNELISDYSTVLNASFASIKNAGNEEIRRCPVMFTATITNMDDMSETEITSLEQLNTISYNALIKIVIETEDIETGKTLKKMLDLTYFK